jgi:drug/metabolite transporter (DMT)-like permease
VKALVWSLLGFAFLFGLLGTVSVSHLIHGGTDRIMASVAMVIIAFVAGALLARREPIKSFLASRPVLWFLFLFNLAVAVLAFLFVNGAQGILAGVGMLVVSLGAGASLALRRGRQTNQVARQP